MTNPDIFTGKHFEIFRQNANELVLNLWDSIARIPKNLEKVHYFDKVMSFDPQDCKDYGFTPTTNYIDTKKNKIAKVSEYKYDTFCIMTFCKERYPVLEEFLNSNPYSKHKALVYISSESDRKYIKHPLVEVITKPVFGEKLDQLISQSRSIIDLGYYNQKGLSFRVFETLHWEKKLITTNCDIKNYDFYIPNNIAVIGKQPVMKREFFVTEYQHVSEVMLRPYQLSQWIRRLIGTSTGNRPSATSSKMAIPSNEGWGKP